MFITSKVRDLLRFNIQRLTPILAVVERIPRPGRHRGKLGRIIVFLPDLVLGPLPHPLVRP